MAVNNVYQREIVEVPFELPDGKVLPHPALVISCDDLDLSAEFVTTIWRDNDATNIGTNIGTSGNNIATDLLAENKRIVDRIVKKKVKPRMTKEQLRKCIIEVCVVDHSIDELAALLKKSPDYLQNFVIPDLVADGTLLRTKPSHAPGQTYMTNPKLDK